MMTTTPSGEEIRPPLKALCFKYLIFSGAKKVRKRLRNNDMRLSEHVGKTLLEVDLKTACQNQMYVFYTMSCRSINEASDIMQAIKSQIALLPQLPLTSIPFNIEPVCQSSKISNNWLHDNAA
jgi:hypothetical protein